MAGTKQGQTDEGQPGKNQARSGDAGTLHAPPASLRMFTIPAGLPFLAELARVLLDDTLGLGLDVAEPLSLARATVYLPTRRAATAFAGVMSDQIRQRTGRHAALLPRILPLGGLDEAEADLMAHQPWQDGAGHDGLGQNGAEEDALPPPISELRRRMLLARQIELWGRSVNRACFGLDSTRFRLIPERLGEAVALAGNLSELVDTLHSSGVAFSTLAGLDVSRHDRLWEFTHGFLRIAGEWWPRILQAEVALDPADRRNRLIDAECERIGRGRLEGPVIAAGSTGSVPATARLLQAIARSPRGAVILPGLDPWLDDASWKSLVPSPEADDGGGSGFSHHDATISHPQAVMARLIAAMGLDRREIVSLGQPSPVQQARARLASEALRPALTTDMWQEASLHLTDAICRDALGDVTLIEAGDEREEAHAIALALRAALETPGTDAMLATPDRGLAERVVTELARWDVIVEDSAGMPLARTAQGHLARLVLELVTSRFAPGVLLALVSHPCIGLGLTPPERHRATAALELAVLRGQRLAPGWAGLAASLESAQTRIDSPHAPGPLRRVMAPDLALVEVLLERLGRALSPLAALAALTSIDMAEAALAHADALTALTLQADGEALVFSGHAGQPLKALLDELALSGRGLLKGDLADYAAMVATLMQAKAIAPPHRHGVRVTILGLLEARLLQADVMVLAGLNEGIWPPDASTDPFLNRAMRQDLGLPAPERRIGQSAHDLAQAFAGGRVVLTRSAKAGLAQTVPSRFWQRLQAVSPPQEWEQACRRGGDILALSRQVSQPGKVEAATRPRPRPPRSLQPVRYAVTAIETLYRDPYAVFARRILKLDRLEPLEPPLGGRERGTLMHEIVAAFARKWPDTLPPDALAGLMEIGQASFAPLMQDPEVSAFWWPRFAQVASDFVDWEKGRRPGMAGLAVEASSSLELTLDDGTVVTLTAKADRVERRQDGGIVLVDFKTGTMPSEKQIDQGVAAQLTLAAAMARRNGFAPLGAGQVAEMAYVALKAGERSGLASRSRSEAKNALGSMAEEHLAHLAEVLMKYRSGEWGFVSQAMPQKLRFEGDYDALARVKEWSRFAASGDADSQDGGGA